ncbi:hypothetical protein EV210_110174 [Anaerospora hongkongensis]|uniref:Uncharacterized protein n=1 Tax=Anaerospora hongkongensis TaxID=244830 RepID=A0A4R1PXQ7_9FIRM|nr:hypothetical protein [Anaerospora hongkongensis]TCL35929.1 hypothetical protein EV210_110174 [Anaerospora hongkongensis]
MAKRGIPPLFQELSENDNIIGIGEGHKWIRGENTGQKATVVLVRKKLGKDNLLRGSIIPQRLNNRPTDVIEVGDIRLYNDRTGMMRPARPGISIGHYKVSAGTLGAIVKDRLTGETLILSNNHVLANSSDGTDDRAAAGDIILQPGSIDGSSDPAEATIGYLERFIPLNRRVAASQCPIAKLFETTLNKCIAIFRPNYQIKVLRENDAVNVVDCAVARPVSEAVVTDEILGLGKVAGIKEPEIGMEIKKSGRSSGITSSFILATDVTVRVDVGNKEYGIFTDQILAGPMSVPGDSGSLILTEDNHAVGLLFAGSEKVTMLNRIDHVFDALNIRF